MFNGTFDTLCIRSCGSVKVPSNKIRREVLLVEAPEAFICSCTDFHAVAARSEARLYDSISIDQVLTCQGIDLQCISHVWIQQLEYWVHRAHLPVRSQYEWFHARMGA